MSSNFNLPPYQNFQPNVVPDTDYFGDIQNIAFIDCKLVNFELRPLPSSQIDPYDKPPPVEAEIDPMGRD